MTEVYEQAKEIAGILHKAGHIAYFAGGWVRDHLMENPSEDIDIATDAPPIKIMDFFPRTILVGLAFGVVIVVRAGHRFEVATFRKDLPYRDGRRPEGIEMSGPVEDAARRDFTINGMFYDPLTETVHDYVGGREDIRLRMIRTIGDPYERFFEDRLRMLRAFRFASRFGFTIESETLEAIRVNADKLFPSVAIERVWQEFDKMARYPRFDQAIVEMHRVGLLDRIFPELSSVHIKEIRRRVAAFSRFPPECPSVLYLTELFPDATVVQKIEIAKRLKVSTKELKLIERTEEIREAIDLENRGEIPDIFRRISSFAYPDSELILRTITARLPREIAEHCLLRFSTLFSEYSSHIDRIRSGKPLVSSALLRTKGISPGKRMGVLLKEAERIAIDDNSNDPEYVLHRLIDSPAWREFDE